MNAADASPPEKLFEVVFEDADLEQAAKWVLLSAFSNAGQRCASGTRIIIFDGVYDRFRDLLVERASTLRVGTGDADDFGPVINEEQMTNMLAAVSRAVGAGATVLTGGARLAGPGHDGGYFVAPTILERVFAGDAISRTELFGPITILYRVSGFEEAIALAKPTKAVAFAIPSSFKVFKRESGSFT